MIHYKISMLCARVQLDRRYNREVTAIGIQSCPIREVTPRDLTYPDSKNVRQTREVVAEP